MKICRLRELEDLKMVEKKVKSCRVRGLEEIKKVNNYEKLWSKRAEEVKKVKKG